MEAVREQVSGAMASGTTDCIDAEVPAVGRKRRHDCFCLPDNGAYRRIFVRD